MIYDNRPSRLLVEYFKIAIWIRDQEKDEKLLPFEQLDVLRKQKAMLRPIPSPTGAPVLARDGPVILVSEACLPSVLSKFHLWMINQMHTYHMSILLGEGSSNLLRGVQDGKLLTPVHP